MTAPAVKEKAPVLTTADVEQLLRLRYPRNTHALFFGVHDGAGFDKTRTADAIAMGLWPSRGLHLTGFEIKASRSDWLRELKNPAKAESLIRYCDHWYIVAASSEIVRVDELPPTWGLMYPVGTGTLRLAIPAPALPAVAPDRSFLAALLKKSTEQCVDVEMLAAARDEGFGEGKKEAKRSLEGARAEYQQLSKTVREFEQASGISIQQAWQGGKEIGDAVRFVLSRRHETERGTLRRMLTDAQNLVQMIEKTLGEAAP